MWKYIFYIVDFVFWVLVKGVLFRYLWMKNFVWLILCLLFLNGLLLVVINCFWVFVLFLWFVFFIYWLFILFSCLVCNFINFLLKVEFGKRIVVVKCGLWFVNKFIGLLKNLGLFNVFILNFVVLLCFDFVVFVDL